MRSLMGLARYCTGFKSRPIVTPCPVCPTRHWGIHHLRSADCSWPFLMALRLRDEFAVHALELGARPAADARLARLRASSTTPQCCRRGRMSISGSRCAGSSCCSRASPPGMCVRRLAVASCTPDDGRQSRPAHLWRAHPVRPRKLGNVWNARPNASLNCDSDQSGIPTLQRAANREPGPSSAYPHPASL